MKDNNNEVLDIFDYGEYRLVALLSNNRPAYIEFKKDENENYVWRRSEVSHVEGLRHFSANTFGENIDIVIISIRSNGEILQKFTFKVNDRSYEADFSEGDTNVHWNIIDKSDDGDYEFEGL